MNRCLLLFCFLVGSSAASISQAMWKKAQLDSAAMEHVLDSALQMVYKDPQGSKKLVSSHLNSGNLVPYFRSKSLNYIGIAYDVMGNNDSALILYDSAMHVANTFELPSMQASVSNNIGLILWKKGEYEAAITRYDYSLRLFNELGNNLGAANTLNNMGLIYQKMEEFDMGLRSFRSAASRYEEIDHQRGRSAALMNIAAIKDLTNELDSASFYFHEAIRLKKQIGDNYGLGLAYSDYAKNLLKRNHCDSAIMYSRYAWRIFHRLDNEYHQSQVVYSIGKSFLCTGDLDSAAHYLIAAKALAEKKDNLFTLRNIQEQLVKVYSAQRDWKRGFEASQQLQIYEDSLFSIERSDAIFEIKEKFETEQKNREIAEQNAEIALQNEQLAKSELANAQKSFWILLLVLAIAGIITLLFWGQRRAQRKQEMLVKERELKIKEEHLRISKELHDNIGARLSHIISSLDIQLYKNKEDGEIAVIAAFAKDTMNQLRETIWAVSDKTIFYSELKQRIEHYITQTNSIASCSIRYMNTCTADFELSATQTINIFRIVQEAINNALKYSEATGIEVKIERKGEESVITVKDNGTGFDVNRSVHLGNGLKNMELRASEIGARMFLESDPGAGTNLKLTFPCG